jgi:flagellar biosynthesis protein FlhA
MKLSEVQQIIRNLLDEGVPIRPLNLILETIGDHVSHSKDPDYLTEKVRQRLSRSMCQRLQDSRSRILAITLDPGLEDLLGTSPICPPNVLTPLVEQLKAYASALEDQSRSVVLLVNPQIRRQVYSTLRGAIAQLHVLSTSEISSDTHIESVGMVELSELLVS